MKTAVLVDGGFFLKRYRKVFPDRNANDATEVAQTVLGMAIAHVTRQQRPKTALYRVFFYDCPPLQKKMHLPMSGRAIDYAKSDTARFRTELHDELRRQRKVALRLGRLSDFIDWQLRPLILRDLRRGKMNWSQACDDWFELGVRQKAVDIKIGVDIASLAYKRQVDQIVLIAGDADFVPAAKLARREGIDFILDPLWQKVSAELFEHIDGLTSVCSRPRYEATDTDGTPSFVSDDSPTHLG